LEIVLKAFLAAVATLALERLPDLVEAWRVRRRNFALLGSRHGYHLSHRKGVTVILESTWTITRGFLVPFRVHYRIETGLEYKGKFVFEGHDRIVFFGNAGDGREHVVYRFPNPLISVGDSVTGVWLSYDNDKHIASGAALLATDKLSKAEAVEEFKRSITVSSMNGVSVPLLRVNG
jgi:hypothetical protein